MQRGGMKENVPPISRPAKMTSELFSALFEVQDEAQGTGRTGGPARASDVVDVVDLTTCAPLTDREQTPVSSEPASTSSASDFCSRCLVSLRPLNFLAKLTHVKTCGGRVVDGDHAVARFLSYYGYEELQSAFKGIGMDSLVATDLGSIEQRTGVKGLCGLKKFELALNQYKQTGRLLVRNGIIRDRNERGGSMGASKRKEQTERSSTWIRSTTVVNDNNEQKIIPARRPRAPGLTSDASSLDKVLLESLWKRPHHAGRKRINITACSTLWVAAGACQSNHVGIEERLRRAKQARGSRHTREELESQARRARDQAAADRLATKRMRLKALQDELTVQEQTVRELQWMIAELQEEIDEELGTCTPRP